MEAAALEAGRRADWIEAWNARLLVGDGNTRAAVLAKRAPPSRASPSRTRTRRSRSGSRPRLLPPPIPPRRTASRAALGRGARDGPGVALRPPAHARGEARAAGSVGGVASAPRRPLDDRHPAPDSRRPAAVRRGRRRGRAGPALSDPTPAPAADPHLADPADHPAGPVRPRPARLRARAAARQDRLREPAAAARGLRRVLRRVPLRGLRWALLVRKSGSCSGFATASRSSSRRGS